MARPPKKRTYKLPLRITPRPTVESLETIKGLALKNEASASTFSAVSSKSKTTKKVQTIQQTKLCMRYHNVSFNPQRFGAVMFRLLPKLTSLLFSNGACLSVGANCSQKALFMNHCVRLLLQDCQPDRHLCYKSAVKANNYVRSLFVGHNIDLSRIEARPNDIASWAPNFPGMFYTMFDPPVKLVIFDSGKINIPGYHSRQNTIRALKTIMPVLAAAKTMATFGNSHMQQDYRIQSMARRADAVYDQEAALLADLEHELGDLESESE